jgi:hypothetical protein
MKFRDLSIGKTFDFISPKVGYNSFYRTVIKTSARGYMDESGNKYKVGSLNAEVYHVGISFKPDKRKKSRSK